jgi:hypothetical protein
MEEASAYLAITPAQLRRVLRSHGLGAVLRAAGSKRVLIRRTDLDTLRPAAERLPQRRRGVA